MYIKMSEDKNLLITVPTTIYRGETNADLITFLIPSTYEGKNVADCAAVMKYITPGGVGRSDALVYKPEMYKGHLQFSTPVNTRFTAEEGTVVLWLTFFDANDSLLLKSGEAVINVDPSKNIADYMPKEDLDQLEQLATKVAQLEKNKADNIVFNDSDNTIQLTASGQAIGNRISVSTTETDIYVVKVELSEAGEMIVTFSDGTVENLGVVTCDGSAVYVPHIDARKILTFTIENEPGEIPDPVDLNPHDEWSSVDETEIKSDYIWEMM